MDVYTSGDTTIGDMGLRICGPFCTGCDIVVDCITGDIQSPGGVPLPLGSRCIWDELDIKPKCGKFG